MEKEVVSNCKLSPHFIYDGIIFISSTYWTKINLQTDFLDERKKIKNNHTVFWYLSFIQEKIVAYRKIPNKLHASGLPEYCSYLSAVMVMLFTIMHVLGKVLFFLVLWRELI